MPTPIGFVVKNGSKARSITTGGMPVPLSETHIDTYWPGSRSRSSAVRSSSQRLAVSMVSVPPSGIASRALMHKFRSAFSSWGGSTSVDHSPPVVTVSTVIAGPTVRRIKSSIPATRRFTSGRLRIQRLRRDEGEQPMCQCRRALGRPLGSDHVAVELADAALLDPGLHQFERTGDAREEIVEVVREPARELTDRFHLLALAERLLKLALLRRLDPDPGSADGPPILAEVGVSTRQHPADGTPGMPDAVFEFEVAGFFSPPAMVARKRSMSSDARST